MVGMPDSIRITIEIIEKINELYDKNMNSVAQFNEGVDLIETINNNTDTLIRSCVQKIQEVFDELNILDIQKDDIDHDIGVYIQSVKDYFFEG